MQITTIEHPIKQIHQANLVTIGKYKSFDLIDWKKVDLRGLFLGEHSTIEWIPLYIYSDIRRDVAMHIVRHTKQHPRFVVQSGRPDWTGIPRGAPDSIIQFSLCINPLGLISMARQRLCYKAMEATRQWMESIVQYLRVWSGDDEVATFSRGLSNVLVPDCVYRGSCCQKKGCGRYALWQSSDIGTRYQKYTDELLSRIDDAH